MKDFCMAYMVISFMTCTSMHKIEVISAQRNRQLPVCRTDKGTLLYTFRCTVRSAILLSAKASLVQMEALARRSRDGGIARKSIDEIPIDPGSENFDERPF